MNFSYAPWPKPTATSHKTPGGLLHGRAPISEHQKLEAQTRKWVGMSFFGPMLKQMRQSPWHSDLLEGGQESQGFQEMYDQKLAEHMTRGSGDKLVHSIMREIEAKAAYSKQKELGSKAKAEREAAIRMEKQGADRMPRNVGSIRQMLAHVLAGAGRARTLSRRALTPSVLPGMKYVAPSR